MKNPKFLIPAILGISIILFVATSFTNDEPAYYYSGGYSPVFMERVDLEKSVSYKPEGKNLVTTGKIYIKDNYIYVNEKYKGIHVIDNTDKYNPKNIGFITAPGCIDMAAKGNILYLDNSVDLVAFDLDTKEVTKRIINVFPEPKSPENTVYYGNNRPEDMILVEWKLNK